MRKLYSNNRVILKKLTLDDASSFFAIYLTREKAANFEDNPFLENETPGDFTRRIMGLCECIFTIRTAENPNRIIGDCALHDWDPSMNEIEIGGSLVPEFWGQGLMQSAFDLLIGIAKNEFLVKTIIGKTNTQNEKAIRLVQKMGFQKGPVSGNEIIMRKLL